MHVTTLANLSASDLRRAAEIKDQIEALQSQLSALLAGDTLAPAKRKYPRIADTANGAPVKKFHWTQTPEGKAKMARLMSARWKTRKSGQPRGKAKGGKTVAACILEALGGGATMPIKAITAAASKLRGKKISPALMSFTLAQLKKAKQVANPERGQYRKA
jgi:hypothetical protein